MATNEVAPAPMLDDFKASKKIQIQVHPTDRQKTARSVANLAAGSVFCAARVITAAENKSDVGELLDMGGLVELLRDHTDDAQQGRFGEAEAMLINQAAALQSIFVRLAERALHSGDRLPQFEAHMRLAFRAQAQCRATIETLATIKNPPVIIAKQANVTSGPQQINNGTPASSRAQEIETEQHQLLESANGKRMDAGTASKAVGGDPAMATVGEIDRTTNPRRKGPGGKARVQGRDPCSAARTGKTAA